MHFPKVNSDVLIFPASFKRSPLFWVFAQRSDPARSHRDSLDGIEDMDMAKLPKIKMQLYVLYGLRNITNDHITIYIYLIID